MKLPLSPKQFAVASVSVLLAATGIVGSAMGSAWLSVAAIVALQVVVIALLLMHARRLYSIRSLLQRGLRRAKGNAPRSGDLTSDDYLEQHLTLVRGAVSARMDGIESMVQQSLRDLAAAATHLEQASAGGATSSAASAESPIRAKDLSDFRHTLVTELDAMHQIHRRFPLDGPVPLMWGWALSPRSLLQVLDLALEGRPRVVECGSGTSTIYLAKAFKDHAPHAKVVALEHLTEFAAQVRGQLEDLGLSAWAEVRDAPLRAVTIDEDPYDWYDLAGLDLDEIELLLVDGPPSATGPLARLPAFPLLRNHLADDAVIVLDDLGREDERETVDRWLKDPALTRQRSRTSDQAVLRWRKGSLSSSET